MATLVAVVAGCRADPPNAPLGTASQAVPAPLAQGSAGPVPLALDGAVGARAPEVLERAPRALRDPAAFSLAVGEAGRRPSDGTRADLAAVGAGPNLVWQNRQTGERSIWLMTGTSWGREFTLLPTVATAWQIVGSGDFNADGTPDLVWQNLQTGERSLWLMGPGGTSWGGQFVLLPTVAVAWRIAAVADFNHDGKPDLVWQNLETGARSIWFMNGTQWNGSAVSLPAVAPAWTIAAAADLDIDADGMPELVWQNLATGERSIWILNWTTWGPSQYVLLPTVTPAWTIVGAGDLSGDGRPDLVWQNLQTGERSVWIMFGTTWRNQFVMLPTIPATWSIATVSVPGGQPPSPVGLVRLETGYPFLNVITAGVPITPVLTVQVLSREGVVLTRPGVLLTASIAPTGSTTSIATLTGATATTDAAGRASFPALTVNGAPGTYQIRVSTPGAFPGPVIPVTIPSLVDVTPPTVVSITASPSTVEVTSAPASTTLRLRITDVGNGVDAGTLRVGLVGPIGPRADGCVGASLHEAGTLNDGTFACVIAIPLGAAPGRWTLDYVWVSDRTGNPRQLWASSPADGPVLASLFSGLTVIGPVADVTPPSIVSIGFSPTTVDLTAGSPVTTVTVRVADAQAGVQTGLGAVGIRGPTDRYVFCPLNEQVSGTSADGVFACPMVIPPGSAPGAWLLEYVTVRDRAGNATDLFRPRNGALLDALSRGITVTGPPPDVTPPQIVSVSFSPATVNTSQGPASTVASVRVTDNGSGVRFDGVMVGLVGPNGRYLNCDGMERVSGTPADGIHQCTLSIPVGSASGLWRLVSLNVTDITGNFVVADEAALRALSPGITVR